MKKCINCNWDVRDNDTYCRNCGCFLQSSKNYVFINVLTIIIVICLIAMIGLFIASYLVG